MLYSVYYIISNLWLSVCESIDYLIYSRLNLSSL